MKKIISQPRVKTGFSILELLIAVIIIGVLATVMVPSLSRRAEEGKVKAALRDLNELREAQTRIAIDLGYYVPMHILDDVISSNPLDDSIAFEYQNPRVQPNREKVIFIDPRTGDFMEENMARRKYDQMVGLSPSTSTDIELRRRIERFGFRGPYVNWNRDTNKDGMQEDPWGNPYLFFTRLGLVYDYNAPYDDSLPPESQTRRIQHRIETSRWDHETYQTGTGSLTDVFDRFCVLSMGPNGIPGGDDPTDVDTYLVFGEGDDIVIYFH